MGIPIKGADGQNYTTRTETGTDGQETQIVSGISDWILRRLFKAFSRLSFDASSQLRVAAAGTVSVSSGTVTTVTTVTTGNIGMGDAGKPSTAIVFSRQLTANSTRRNLIRS